MPTVAKCAKAFPEQHGAAEDGDLTLAVGDLVTVLEQADDGWWRGFVAGRGEGLFPGSFVDILDPAELQALPRPGSAPLIEDVPRPPPAALRFAYDGAGATEGAVLRGLAAAYEGLFRLAPGRVVNGRPAFRHVERGDKWIAFSGSGWMAQDERALGTTKGVLLLKDMHAESPDASRGAWYGPPGWVKMPGLRCLGMSDDEATSWELDSNPWNEGANANETLENLAAQLALDPNVQIARDKEASTAERLAAMDRLQYQQQQAMLQMQKMPQSRAAALLPPSGGGAALPLKGAAGETALAVAGGGRGGEVGGGGGRGGGGRGNGRGGGGSGSGRQRGIIPMAGGVYFVGSAGSSGKPHGGGELLLRDGSVHVGLFEEGAAHGDGVYYDKSGAVHTGRWVSNHRVGTFEVLDPAGGLWDDVYDQWGKRTSRKRVDRADDAPGGSADVCRHCGCKFHPQYNYSCRRQDDEQRGASGGRDEPSCRIERGHEA